MVKDKDVETSDEVEEAVEHVSRGKLKKATMITLSVLASAALFIIIVFTCLEAVAFDEGYYHQLQSKYGIETDTGMSTADLQKVTHELLLYCKGERAVLQMQAVINGETKDIYSQREIDHMVDVQRLFVKGLKTRTVLIISFLFLLLVLLYVARRRTLYELARGWVIAVSALGVLLVVIGVAFAINFDWAWTQFHLIFFTNDLWQLYSNDILILMLSKLFDSLVLTIIIVSGVALAAVTAVAVFVLLREKKKLAKAEADEPEPRQ